jgi:hypothetical protein
MRESGAHNLNFLGSTERARSRSPVVRNQIHNCVNFQNEGGVPKNVAAKFFGVDQQDQDLYDC